MSWYGTSYRKLFFDFHSRSTVVGLAKGFDAQRWAQRLQDAHVQAVSIFVKCGAGYSFGQRGSLRYLHPHLPDGIHMLEGQLQALHERGMRGIGYYHIFNSEPVAAAHPEWIEREADGSPRDYSVCIFSPALEEWVLPSIAELVTNYDLDGMFFDMTFAYKDCFCQYCQERFAQATGGLPLPKDDADANWPLYIKWKLGAYDVVRRAISQEIHSHRPEMNVAFNWAYSMREPELVPDGVDSLMADIFPDDQSFNGSYLSRYWATQGRPFDIMSSAFLQWWGDWGCKPAVAMQQEAATIIANGGLTWIGYQMNERYDIDQAVLDELGQTMAFVEERESLLEGAEPVPYVAALRSTSSNICADKPSFYVDQHSPRGLHRALTESGIPYLWLHEQALLERLDEFKVLILADQRHIPDQLADALNGWVQRGGVLIVTALTGTVSAENRTLGRFRLQDLLGLQYVARYDQTHAYVKVTDDRLKPGTLDMAHLAQCPVAFARPIADDVEVLADLHRIYLRSDGQFLLRWSPVGDYSGFPAITVRPVGQGKVAYVAADIFYAYSSNNQWNFKHLAANLIRLLAPELPVEIESPAWLEVVHTRQRDLGRQIVHLVNSHGNRPVDRSNVCVEQVLPVRDVTVRLRLPQAPGAVSLEPQGEKADWTYESGILTVRLPEVRIHTAVVVS